MARRIIEQELLAQEGKSFPILGPGKGVDLVKDVKLTKSFGGVYSLQFNPGGDILAVGYGAGGVQLFDPNTGMMTKELRACRQGGYAVMALNFHPKDPDLLYAATTEGHIYVFDVTNGELKGTIEEPGNEINTIDFSVDGYNFATGGRDLNVRVYETKSNKLVRTWEGQGKDPRSMTTDSGKVANTMRVFSIKFHPNNQYLFVSGGWDNHLKIWDIRDNEGIKRNISGPHICGDAVDMKGNNILAGQWTALHSLQEIDYTSGKVVREIEFPHSDGAFLYAAQYVNDNTVIAGGSGTNTAEVIELGTNRRIGGFKMESAVHAVDSALNGKVLAVGGAAHHLLILRLQD